MNSTAAISVFAVIVAIGPLKCNANKTKLIVTLLKIRSEDKATSVGIDLAIEAAKKLFRFESFLRQI